MLSTKCKKVGGRGRKHPWSQLNNIIVSMIYIYRYIYIFIFSINFKNTTNTSVSRTENWKTLQLIVPHKAHRLQIASHINRRGLNRTEIPWKTTQRPPPPPQPPRDRHRPVVRLPPIGWPWLLLNEVMRPSFSSGPAHSSTTHTSIKLDQSAPQPLYNKFCLFAAEAT